MIRYKLLTQDYCSHGGTGWRRNGKWLTVKATGAGNELCSADVIHFYEHPVLALLFNPCHGHIENPRLFKITAHEIVAHDGLKGGCKSAKIINEIPLPSLSLRQRVEFGVRVAAKALKTHDSKIPVWSEWAEGFLNNRGNCKVSANDASHAAATAAAASRAAAAAAYHAAAASEAADYAAQVTTDATVYVAHYVVKDAAIYAAISAVCAVDAAAYAAGNEFMRAAACGIDPAFGAKISKALFIPVLKEMRLYDCP